MAGLDYLVGVRFKAYGNLLGEIGKYSFALAGLEGLTGVLKNKFVDLSAAGIGAFVELTKAAENYQKMLATLEIGLRNATTAHKAMHQALSTKGAAGFLTPEAGVTRGMLLGGYFGAKGLNPKSEGMYNRTVEMLRGTYGMSSADSSGFMQKFLSAGLGYAQARGVPVGKQENYAIHAAQLVAANMGKFVDQGAYLSNIRRAMQSPYAGTTGLSTNMLFGSIGLDTLLQQTRGVGSGATNRLMALMTGNASRAAVETAMLNGFHVGVNGSVAMAVGGHPYAFSRRQMLSFISDPRLLAKTMLPTLEAGSPYAGMSLRQVERDKAALSFLSVRAKAELASSHSGMYSKFLEGLFFTPHDYRHFGEVSPFTNKYDAPVVNALNRLSGNLDKLGDVIGKQAGPMVAGVVGGLGAAAGWVTSAAAHHPWVGKAMAVGSLVATGIGISGIVKGIGTFLSKVPAFGLLGRGVGLLGDAGMLGTAGFGGWEIGKILDKVFPKFTGGLGKDIVGGWLGIFDAMKAFFSWISGNTKGVVHDIHQMTHAFSFMAHGLTDMAQAVGISIGSSPLHAAEKRALASSWMGAKGSAVINSFGKYDPTTGELPVTYTETEKGKSAASRLDVYLHGEDNTKDIAHAIAQSLQRVVTGEGRNTARPLASGVGG